MTRRRLFPGPFSTLLFTVLVVLMGHPFMSGFGRDFLNLAFAVIMVSALRSLQHPTWAFKVGLSLMIPAYVVIGIEMASPDPTLRLGRDLLVLGAFAFTAYIMVVDTMKARNVTVEQISASLAAYVLFGVVWAIAYSMLESYLPGSLDLGPHEGGEKLFDTCIYFSFVTLTTLGYGDILPISEPARALAYGEAILGQLYLAVLVAKLVGMYTSDVQRSR